MPITLDVTGNLPRNLRPAPAKSRCAMLKRDVGSVCTWKNSGSPDRRRRIQGCVHSTSKLHPGADYTMNKATRGTWRTHEGLQGRHNYDFRTLRFTQRSYVPSSSAWGGAGRLPFQTRNPMHRPTWTHFSCRQASRSQPLIHPVGRNDEA